MNDVAEPHRAGRCEFAQPFRHSGNGALPHRVRDRRSARHGDRDGFRLGKHRLVAISVALAFVFGNALTLGPILTAGVPYRRAVALTVASDTISIATKEVTDNAFLLVVPGALAAGLSDRLFWSSLALSLAVAFAITVPLNRWLISRGRGHAVVHHLH